MFWLITELQVRSGLQWRAFGDCYNDNNNVVGGNNDGMM